MSELEAYFDRLWPICRSITGPGYRQSLDILSELMPMTRYKFATGSQVFDWVVPKEWSVSEAYLVDPKGNRRADIKKNNLHLVSYSIPFRGKLSLSDLKSRVHTLPDQPDAIPYVTSYYNETWGFCMSHREFQELPEGQYEVVVDSELKAGSVEVGEAILPGEGPGEVLFSSYLCHPSLANNELSGPLVLASLYKRLKALPKRRYSYRFVVAPETIGSICYLSLRGEQLKTHLKAGFVITCVGDPGRFTYKRSRAGNTLADRAAEAVLKRLGDHEIVPFFPSGSDERQYCSPGFNLPVGSLMRTMYGRYPEYHTSLDNKGFISFEAMGRSIDVYVDLVKELEQSRTWVSKVPFCEPQLGKRGLYPKIGGGKEKEQKLDALRWVLNLADGKHDLPSMADRSGLPEELLAQAIHDAEKAGLIESP